MIVCSGCQKVYGPPPPGGYPPFCGKCGDRLVERGRVRHAALLAVGLAALALATCGMLVGCAYHEPRHVVCRDAAGASVFDGDAIGVTRGTPGVYAAGDVVKVYVAGGVSYDFPAGTVCTVGMGR